MGGSPTTFRATGVNPYELGQFQSAVRAGQQANIQGLISQAPYLYQKPQLSYLDKLTNLYAQTSENKNREFEKEYSPGAYANRLAVDQYYADLASGNDQLLNKAADLATKRGLSNTLRSGLRLDSGQSLGQNALGSEVSGRMLQYLQGRQQQQENYAKNPRQIASLDAVSATNLENSRMGQNQSTTNSLIGNIFNANQDVNKNVAAFGQQGIGYYGQEAANEAQARNYNDAMGRQRRSQAWGSLARAIPFVGSYAGAISDAATA